MRLLGVDLESTGLLTDKDRIIELGLSLWEWTPAPRPLVSVGIFLYDETYPQLSKEITDLTGITDEMLKEFGTKPKDQLTWLDSFSQKHGANYLVAHNGANFDIPLLHAELTRNGVAGHMLRSLPLIDTRADIPFEKEPDSRKLKYMAADHYIPQSKHAHRAMHDVLLMMEILSQHDLNKVISYQKIPFIVVRAMVSYEDRELAKAQRYSWERIGEKTFAKSWVKRIKLDQLEKERAACKFPVVQIE